MFKKIYSLINKIFSNKKTEITKTEYNDHKEYVVLSYFSINKKNMYSIDILKMHQPVTFESVLLQVGDIICKRHAGSTIEDISIYATIRIK
jgi:hypothetical protein